jgi:NNP family nitrate/nitrite transporter-like MFS transporter
MTLEGSPNRALAGATIGFFVGFAAVALFSPIAQSLKSAMSLSPVLLGFAVAAPLLSGSLLRIPFSAWVDTTGGRKPFLMLLTLSTLGMAGLLVVFKLHANSYPLLLALGVLCGCGIAAFSVGIGQVSYWFPQSGQGLALGTYAGLGNVAPGIFSFLLPVAIGAWGLIGAYWAWLIFLLAGTLAYALISRDAWYFQLRRRGIRDADARRIAREKGQEIFPAGTARVGLFLAAKRSGTWVLVALYFATFGGFLALTTWLPIFWISYYKLSPAAAGFLTALFSIGASLTRIGGGSCADRFTGERTALMGLCALLAGSLLISFSASLPLSVAAVMLMAVGMGINNAAVFKMVPKYVPDAVGGASGWVGGLGAFGGFVLPPAMGLIAELCGPAGYASCFLIFTVLAVMGIVLATTLKPSAVAIAAEELDDAKARVA